MIQVTTVPTKWTTRQLLRVLCLAFVLTTGMGTEVLGEEPSLPLGLGENVSEEPALPVGIGDTSSSPTSTPQSGTESLPFGFRGLLETRGGVRVFDSVNQKSASIGEFRWQNQIDREWSWGSTRVTADLVADPVANDWPLELETGKGFLDLREAFALLRVGSSADIKLGRQILTWGTGDFLFINDLFPKDWNSFFIGRDDEYLKAPSDAVKVSLFSDAVNLDVVYTPSFDHDRYLDGQRISFFNPLVGDIAGRERPFPVEERTSWFRDDEFSARLYQTFGSYEAALYGYYGYWKSPGGFRAQSGEATFPKLAVYGASLRGPLLSGIANVEFGYYDSREDRSGDDPLTRNSELRALFGYEQELARNLNLGAQYYLEKIIDYDDFRRTLPAGGYLQEEYRQLLTLRLTRLLLNQNLRLSLFTFYSPTDADAYPRASANYKWTDNLTLELGTNFFFGDDQRSFFAQFEDSSNVYAACRWSFLGT